MTAENFRAPAYQTHEQELDGHGSSSVTLQAKVGRHYRSFRQLRGTSRTGGRIRTAYRFERTTRPVRYRFRLKVVRQAGLPFRSGVSPVVGVSVRP